MPELGGMIRAKRRVSIPKVKGSPLGGVSEPTTLASAGSATRSGRVYRRGRVSRRSSTVLFILTFLLIYGPRLYGSFLLDVISLASIGLVAYSLLRSRFRVERVRGGFLPIAVFYCLFSYSLLVAAISRDHELFYPLKFARTTVNYLAVYILCSWYRRKYGPTFIYFILEHVFWAIAVHAAIMVLQYVNSDIARVLYSLSGFQRSKPYRVTGLTITYNTLSIVQGFGLLLAITLQHRFRKGWKRRLFLLASTLILISLFLAGRTAAYVMFFFAAVALLVGWRRHLMNRRAILTAAGVCVLVLGLSRLVDDPVGDRFATLTLPLLLDPIQSYLESGTTAGTYGGETARKVFREMYFLPEDGMVLLFGSSISGRGDVYVASDAGYVQLVFGIGIVGTALVVAFYVYLLAVGIRWRKYDPWIAFLSVSLTSAVLVVNLKEQVLLTRHAFTLSALLLCSWYFIRSYSSGGRRASLAPTSSTPMKA